mgnify:FL=1
MFTVAELAVGGCLSALSSIRAGFKHIWTTEIDEDKTQLAEALTQAPCLGDTFAQDYKQIRARYGHCSLLKSGQPCRDWSSPGPKTGRGADCDTGWMYTAQVECILDLEPDTACLEQVAHVMKVDKDAVSEIIARLEPVYVVHCAVINVWTYGDPCNRERLIIIAIHRKFGALAEDYEVPRGDFHAGHAPQAWMVACEDEDVPEHLWRTDPIYATPWREPVPGRLHLIGTTGRPGMGYSDFPNAVYSWQSLYNCQTSHNGGGRRPELNWKSGEPFKRTRLTTIPETIKIASLPSDYEAFARGVKDDDKFIRELVNLGWPLRFANAMDSSIMAFLERAYGTSRDGARGPRDDSILLSGSVSIGLTPRSILVDSGAQISCVRESARSLMENPQRSEINITSANTCTSECKWEGMVQVNAVNTTGMQGVPKFTPFSFRAVTMEPLTKELLSITDLLKLHKYELRLSHTDNSSCFHRPATKSATSSTIPIRYNKRTGQHWVDYIDQQQYKQYCLTATYAKRPDPVLLEAMDASILPRTYGNEQVTKMIKQLKNDDNSAVEEVIIAQHAEDRSIKAVKQGLSSKEKRSMSAHDFHCMMGHLGSDPDCIICREAKGTMRFIRRTVDPHRETRVAYSFALDMLVMSERDRRGFKYVLTLKCLASSAYRLIPLYLKSDAHHAIEEWITELRASPYFKNMPYAPCSHIHTDQDGAWSQVHRKFQKTMTRLGVIVTYATKDRHERTNPVAERAIAIVEVVVKSILLQANLGPDFWSAALSQCEFLLNRLPVVSHEVNQPIDGDRIRPLEALTRGSYSRRTIDKELSTFLPLGMPALVNIPAVRGSSLKSKARWGIAMGMLGSQCEFMCPFKLTRFWSKSFVAFKLRGGLNYAQFLGLPPIGTMKGAGHVPEPLTDEITIKLKEAVEHKMEHKPPITFVWQRDGKDMRLLKPAEAGVTVHPLGAGSGVAVVSDDGQLLRPEGIECYFPAPEQVQKATTPQEIRNPETSRVPSETVDIKIPKRLVELAGFDHLGFDKVTVEVEYCALPVDVVNNCNSTRPLDNHLGSKFTIRKGRMTFPQLCRILNLRTEDHNTYKEWLTEIHGFSPDSLHTPKNKFLMRGMVVPPPQGAPWRHFKRRRVAAGKPKDSRGAKRKLAAMTGVQGGHNHDSLEEEEATENKLVANLVLRTYTWLKAGLITATPRLKAYTKMAKAKYYEVCKVYAKRYTKKRIKAIASNTSPPPTTIEKALNMDEPTAYRWLDSILDEWNGLGNLGVLDHGHTLEECRKMGIHTTTVPLSIVLDHKFDEKGDLKALKTRLAVRGTKKHMRPGEHYSPNTYASTPNMNTTRLLMALVIKMSLHQLCWDITKAYVWAPLADHERIILQYPRGFERFHPETGEPLFMVMLRNLYGAPNASRNYSIHRDKFIMSSFNKDGWTCQQSLMDPCLFTIEHRKKRTWMLCYVDDIDCASESKEDPQAIFEIMDKAWKCKVVPSDFILGVMRTRSYDSEGRLQMKLNMEAYIKGMKNSFEEFLSPRTLHTPCEPSFLLSLQNDSTEAMHNRVLARGYQSAVGMILWAARCVFPQTLFTVGQLCKQMSKPTEKAWDAAMRLIAWMYQNKTAGITFRSDGNPEPIFFSDATNVGDPTDSKRAYGYCGMFMGGPVIAVAKKLEHCSSSTSANEYMAMAHAIKNAIWLRQLLQEMKLGDIVSKPTRLLADNNTANGWAGDQMFKVSNGNMWILQSFHYAREMCQTGHIAVEYVNTRYNISDLFTKGVSKETFQALEGFLLGREPLSKLFEAISKQMEQGTEGT